MIITRLDGGLGNQMFQYAFGLHLARTHECPLLLDLGSYEKHPQHGYLLDRFQIEASPVDDATMHRVPKRYRSGPTSSSAVDRFLNRGALKRVKEVGFGFRKSYLSTPQNRYLVGYWQSENFFPGLRPELLRQFQLTEQLTQRSAEVVQQMHSQPSLAVHVRRGDYINNVNLKIYERLSLNYYLHNIEAWAESMNQPHIYVFSNDIRWCRESFRLPWTTHFIDHTDANSAHEDLAMMQHAQCLLMANSTFSWWAAWLNQRADRQIIAPARWFRPGTFDDSSILCSDWTRASLEPTSMYHNQTSQHAA